MAPRAKRLRYDAGSVADQTWRRPGWSVLRGGGVNRSDAQALRAESLMGGSAASSLRIAGLMGYEGSKHHYSILVHGIAKAAGDGSALRRACTMGSSGG